MSVLRNIRLALEARTETAQGMLPAAQIAHSDVLYTPRVNVPFIRTDFQPTSTRPWMAADTFEHIGLFQIDVTYPTAQGLDVAEMLADNVVRVFTPPTIIWSANNDRIQIDYAERNPALQDGAWIAAPITIGWRCFASSATTIVTSISETYAAYDLADGV